jgi:hypothetical protein
MLWALNAVVVEKLHPVGPVDFQPCGFHRWGEHARTLFAEELQTVDVTVVSGTPHEVCPLGTACPVLDELNALEALPDVR